jgi:DNA-binding beta-propeller fold protein YncE
MRAGGRWVAGSVAACLVGVLFWAAIALAGPGPSDGSTGSPTTAGNLENASLALRSSPLLALGGSSSEEQLQSIAAQQARRETPAAKAARLASRVKFEHLGAARAARVAREAFPEAIDHPLGGPPRLAAGTHITRYIGDNAAQLALPGGKHAVVESLQPMARETSGGHHAPIDLGLTRAGGVFKSVRPVVGVLIPQRLSEGVELPEAGLSLTPVNSKGSPLGGSEGTLDGASVVYANTQTDTDTTVKPTIDGVEANTILRSVDSPEQLYFHVGLPPGASLVRAKGGAGPVKVMNDGQAIALVRPPSAVDAAGTSVPVSMSVRGDLLALTVSAQGGEYQWPVAVDPEVKDESLGPSECHKKGEPERISSNWCVYSGKAGEAGEDPSKEEGPSRFKHHWYANSLVQSNAEYIPSAGEYTVAVYHTQGQSKIFKIQMETAGSVRKARAKLELAKQASGSNNEQGELEHSELIAEATGESVSSWGWRESHVCAEPSSCTYTAGAQGNVAAFKLEADEPGASMEAQQGNTIVYIYQENGPETSPSSACPGCGFNTTSSELDEAQGKKRVNVLYGPGAWLGPYSGALEVTSHDPGIGISREFVQGEGFRIEAPISEAGKCNGDQCNETYSTAITYMGEGGNPEDKYEHMPEGDHSFELFAEDDSGAYSYTEHTVKVDATPPHGLEVGGWSKSREISAAPHTLTVEATDGEKPTPSSGVRSISASIDGGPETVVLGAACPEGPCTASGKYTLDAENLTEGVHRLVVTATDNANNVSATEWTFDVRHGSPVPVGPGTVDPTTGQLKLSATDVSLAGAGGVSRVYQSRNLTAGLGGPLGPQWTLGLGGGEGLTVLPNGSVVLASSTGATTTFTRNEKGEFESPLGDANVKIEPKEKEPGKGITEYLLKETTAGTTTTFIQPVGTENTLPVYSSQFGAEGAQLSHPSDVATDASGDLWVADSKNGRIVKFSPSGTTLASYGGYGSWLGNFIEPRGIAINHSTGNVYVSDEGNNRIVELNSSGVFVRAFGWDVDPGAEGREEFQVCTSYCKAGTAGSGNGQFKEVKGLAIDSSGNVWIADAGNNRIQEFNAEGKWLQSLGTKGAGEGQFNAPMGIAFSGSNLYVTEYYNNRVQELSTAGKYISQIGTGKEGSGSNEFKTPRGIAIDPKSGNLYVVDTGNNRVQEFSPSAKLIATIGTAGSGAGQLSEPKGVAISSSGGMYVTDYNNNRIEEWTRPTWLPVRAESPLQSTTTWYAYKAVELEGRTVIEPTETVAPAPSGVTCIKEGEKVVGEALTKGCRALLFGYATKTKAAIGESPGEWGEYNGHLQTVSFKGYNPAKGAEKMEEKAVAEYAYDKQGRMRAEWDPRISPALKITYGYDEEGHVTAVSPSGQEPWLLHYGAFGGDPNMGRLLSVTRPAASSTTVLKEQETMAAPVNTSAPTLSSTSPAIGTTLKVASSGSWSNSPLAYGYQWEDCHLNAKSESECAAISGAVNQSYTPQARDAGYELVVVVTAENIDGATIKPSVESKEVPMSTPEYSSEFGAVGSESEKVKEPTGTAIDAAGNVWVVDFGKNRVVKYSSAGGYLAAYSPDSMLEPVGIAVSPLNGYIYVANRGKNRIDILSPSTGALIGVFGSEGSGAGQLNYPDQIAVDTKGDVWVADFHNSRIDEFSATGEYLTSFGEEGAGNGQFKNVTGITECGGYLFAVDQGHHRVEQFSRKGEYVSQFGSANLSLPSEIACEPINGDLYISDGNVTGFVAEFNLAGKFLDTFSGAGKAKLAGPVGVAIGAGSSIYIADNGAWRLEKWLPSYSTNNPAPEPPTAGSAAVSTIEYNVPLSGASLPNLTEGEVAKWGQKDDPVEGVAIFPANKPMGWPGKEYEAATIDYMDAQGHTVNVASPGGGIATTEYDETNDVIRTLSADDRATALNAGTKSAEVARDLDSENVYSPVSGRLEETLEPEHTVKLAVGKEGKHNEEVQAREHVKYLYDEGAPEGKIYNLVTKTVDSAQLANKEEFDKRTTVTSYGGQGTLGWMLRKPTSVTKDAGGLNLTTSMKYDEHTGNMVETITPGGASQGSPYMSQFGKLGSGSGELSAPKGIAVDAKGDVLVADELNNRIEVFNEKGEYVKAIGSVGSGSGQLKAPRGVAVDSRGDVWVVDTGNNRTDLFNEKGEFQATNGWGVNDGKAEFERCTGASCRVGIAGSGGGQFKEPTGVAIDSRNDAVVTDTGNSRTELFNENGEFEGANGWGVSNGEAKFETCTGSGCQAGIAGSGAGQFKEPTGVAIGAHNSELIVDTGNSRVEVYSENGGYERTFGTVGAGNGEFKAPKGIAVDSHGNVWVADAGNYRVQQLNEKGQYIAQFGAKGTSNGQFQEPFGIQLNTRNEIFVGDVVGNRIQRFAVTSGSGNAGTHNVKTAYYTPGTESPVSACQNHQEWANLPCQTEPAAQPGIGVSPELPVATLTYNLWDEVEATSEKFGTGSGAVTRTKAQTYDAAGRALTSSTTSTIDTALPTVTNKYNAETGALEEQSTTAEGKTKTLKRVLNTLGQQTNYTDADGGTTTYKYESTGDGRLIEVNDGKGTQTYAYDPITGLMTKLVDSAAGTITATYDAEGKMLTEAYPNAITAHNGYNQLGGTTEIKYEKTAHCAVKCPEVWFSDAMVGSIHGETISQASTLAKESYAYDTDGRLVEAQETPIGKDCKSRLYAYDEESNRLQLATRESATETCATTGGSVESHVYDTDNRLIDAGVTYETFGNTTSLPAADAGGHPITSTYYVDNQVLSQEQNGKTITYAYDPAGRARETKSKEGATSKTTITHYPSSGEASSWTEEEGKWTRNIPGIDGALTATQSSAGAVVFRLHDLQGNIVAEAGSSESETKLISSYNSTEFGVPSEGKAPPKYAWLGAGGVSTELSSGVATQGGASYVPQVARDLQTAPVVPPGAFPDGQGTGSQYDSEIPGWYISLSNAESAATIAEYTAKQEALKHQEEAMCQSEPESCSEDPGKVFTISIEAAASFAILMKGYEALSAGGLLKLGDLIKQFFGFDFKSKIEEAIEEGIFGFSDSQVEGWAEALGAELESCVALSAEGGFHTNHPHCWIYVTTTVRHKRKKGAPGVEVPDFKVNPEVEMCPVGISRCYPTEDAPEQWF